MYKNSKVPKIATTQTPCMDHVLIGQLSIEQLMWFLNLGWHRYLVIGKPAVEAR